MKRIVWISSFLLGALLVASVAAAAERYEIDPVHSTVIFRVKHLGVGHFYGRFNEISGTIVLDEADPSRSSVEVRVDTASVDTNDEQRDTHLRSPDFFNAKQFPVIRFESTAVRKLEEGLYEVSGRITINGRTKPLTVKMTRIGSGKDPWGNYRTGFEGMFVLDRSAFGITYMPEGIGKEVLLTVSVEAIRK